MKTLKTILFAATIVSASVVSTLSAQQAAQPAPKHEFKVAIGDSVMIKRECQKYCTGETPSTWVWDKVHTVRQLGTKRFPDGVLLMNIYSWMCEDCLIPVNGRAEEASKKAAEEQKEAKKAFESGTPIEEIKPAEKPAEEVKKEEPVVAPVVEEKPAEEPVAEPAKVEEAPQTDREMEKGDSIKSKQNFKGKYDRFTIGVRGGVASLLHKTDNGSRVIGGEGLLDLQYAHYWTKAGRPVDLGILTGISLGYSQSGMKTGVNSQLNNLSDGDKNNPMTVDYTIRADQVKENDGAIVMEIPLMFTLIHDCGFFFNFGPKLMMPVYTPYKQTISDNANTLIQAHFQETDVTVGNEVITGILRDDQKKLKGTDNGDQFVINVLLGAEFGYEWILKGGNSLGLGAYVDYGVYSSYKNKTSESPLISVTPPQGSNPADVEVLSATKTYASKLGYVSAGVKLAYHFNFPKKRQYKDSKLF
jgi:hypothetical protein